MLQDVDKLYHIAKNNLALTR